MPAQARSPGQIKELRARAAPGRSRFHRRQVAAKICGLTRLDVHVEPEDLVSRRLQLDVVRARRQVEALLVSTEIRDDAGLEPVDVNLSILRRHLQAQVARRADTYVAA
jgi:hypothetical protein